MPEHMQDKDELCKLFVGGLSWDTTKESLYETFIKFGEITDCNVMMNTETGKPRGFGFVTFKDPASVELSLASKPHIVDNRQVDAKPCNKKAAALINKTQKGDDKDKKIFVGGLPLNITEERCREFFSQYGTVTDVVIMYDQVKQRPRGFGFIGFDSQETAQKMCDLHFVSFDGKQVECKKTNKSSSGSISASDSQNPNAWAVAAITQQYTNPNRSYGDQKPGPQANINSFGIDVNNYGYGYGYDYTYGGQQPFGMPGAGMPGPYGQPGYAPDPTGGYGAPAGYGPPQGIPGQPGGGPSPSGGPASMPGGPPGMAPQGSYSSQSQHPHQNEYGYDYGVMGQAYSQQPSSYGPDRSGYGPDRPGSGYGASQQAYQSGYGRAAQPGYGSESQGYAPPGAYSSGSGAASSASNPAYHPYKR